MHKVFAGLSVLAMLAAAPTVQAADFGSMKDTYNEPLETRNWNGAFMGLNIGGGNSKSKVSQGLPQFNIFGLNEANALDFINADRAINGSASDEGVIGGFQVGVQRQIGSVVIGGEIGLNGADMVSKGKCWRAGRGFDFTGDPDPDFSFNANVQCETSVDWTLDAAAKVGYAIRNWMPYATVGYAIAGTTHKNMFSYNDRIGLDGAPWIKNRASFNRADNEVMHGLTYGVGLDYALSDSFIIGAEYRRFDLSADGGGLLGSSDRDLDMNVFRLRASVKTN